MVLSIGIAGLGTVGSGVVRGIVKNADLIKHRTGTAIKIGGVSARSKSESGVDVTDFTWYADARALATSQNIDVFIELIGGGSGIAFECVKLALGAGKTVITANKAMLAEQGEELEKIAQQNHTNLLYEAAIGGGIPIVKALREGLGANNITRIYGILNGTCNYILTTIQKTGRDFADVLQEAQHLGYAEADPSFDVDGLDAAQKLSILASIAFGIRGAYADMHIETIRDCVQNIDVRLAEDMGLTPRLVGVAETKQHGTQLYMVPAFVWQSGTFGGVNDVINACTIQGDLIGETSLIGPGAGGDATASAVLSDIFDVATRGGLPMFNQPVESLSDAQILPMDARIGKYYIRIQGDTAPTLQAFESNAIGILQSVQKGEYTAFIIDTIQEKMIKSAMADIQCVTHRIEKC